MGIERENLRMFTPNGVDERLPTISQIEAAKIQFNSEPPSQALLPRQLLSNTPEQVYTSVFTEDLGIKNVAGI